MHITQEELAFYLQLSHHTVKSVEQGRRPLPAESLNAAVALYDAIRHSQVNRVATIAPTPAPYHHMRRARQMHRQCCRKLDRCMAKLDKMKKAHTTACFSLEVYKTLAQALPTPITKEEQARLLWAQRQIKVTMQHIKDTDPAAQNLLATEIVALKNVAHSLDLIQLNSEHHTPLTGEPTAPAELHVPNTKPTSHEPR